MTYKRLLLPLILVLICFEGQAYGQAWSGILAPTRAIDWSQAGVPGGIPDRTQICATLNPGASLAQVNSAIQNCPPGQVVFVNAGDYGPYTGSVIMKSGVTLRGDPNNLPRFTFTDVNGCNRQRGDICIDNNDWNSQATPANTANWISGYERGTTTIELSRVTGLRPGTLLYLDQLDPTSEPPGPWHCESQTSNPPCSQNPQTQYGIGRQQRGQHQIVRVTALSGNRVSITPGLYAPNWNAGQQPGAWWGNVLPIEGVGVENLILSRPTSAGARGAGIFIHNGYGNWIKNVRSLNEGEQLTAHVFMYMSAHNTVRDSYFYGSNPQAEGYGINSGFNSGDNLIENNITQHIATGLITEGDAGSVYAYNFSVDNYFGGSWQQQDEANHGHGSAYLLREGNIGVGFNADNINGIGCCGTHFRVLLSGRDPTLSSGQAKTAATYAYFPFAFQRYFNLVGSVLGTRNYHSWYETAPPMTGTQSRSWKSVFVIGYSNQNGINCCSIPEDPQVKTTLMRWGNYAACNESGSCNVVRWDPSETASSAALYPGLANPSRNLPPSFYLSTKPNWWGNVPWPAIGPDVTGGNASQVALDAAQRNHVYLIAAAKCYFEVLGGKVDGSNGPLPFNAKNCYSQSSTSTKPAPPTNVSAIVEAVTAN